MKLFVFLISLFLFSSQSFALDKDETEATYSQACYRSENIDACINDLRAKAEDKAQAEAQVIYDQACYRSEDMDACVGELEQDSSEEVSR